MSFKILKLPARLVGHEARYRVNRDGRAMAISIRPDVAKRAGLHDGCSVIVALGCDEHAGQLALKRDDSKVPAPHSRKCRTSGASLFVEITYGDELRDIFPPAPAKARQTMPLEVVGTDKEGAITFLKPKA